MNQLVPKNILAARARLGEGPVWDARTQRLFWVDIYNFRLHQFDPRTGQDHYFEVGEVISALALTDAEQLLLALRDRLVLFDPATEKMEPLCQFAFSHPDTRLNDGKCDAQGRFWIGSISAAAGQAALYRYDPDGSLQVMETGLTISNGLGWSPDGSTFYLTDSAVHKIYAYNFEAATGTIRDRRVLIDLSQEAVEPDGLAIDREGNLWSALWNGWGIVCFSPSGQELFRVPLPVQRPTSVTFGGSDLTDLYITSASVGLSQTEIQQGFMAGDLFHCSTPLPGLPTHQFLTRSG
uniref:SMP-30/Gluconolaconase/LRE domain protein n=1 Tax=Cyanothece sp. (strain PCC 7425 / ATCC 29141) TaxID=395961 RepID=B8HS74_CYAP4